MDTNINHLLDQIRYNQLVVPAFQREYVWNLDQAKQLVASLYLRYPTGSLLFWETANPPELKNPVQPKTGTLINVILDGQQRLTTLYLLLTDEVPPYYLPSEIEHDPRNLYFNLETAEFKYYNGQEMAGNPLWLRVPDLFKSEPQPLELAMARLNSTDLSAIMQLANTLTRNLSQFKGILHQTYPIQVVPNTANIDDAIRVFDLVNRQGTKLTEAELALAHMSGRWPQIRDILKQKLEALRSKNFDFDLTFMVRCMTAVVTGRAEYEQIHGRSRADLEEGWNKLDRVLDYLVSILPSHAYIHSTDDLNTTNVLVPLVAYLAQHDSKFATARERDLFLHWLFAALLGARYSGQTDQRLDKDVGITLKSPTPTVDLENAILDQRGRLEVRPGDLEGRDVRNPIYRLAFIVAKSRGAVDWFTGTPLSVLGPKNRGVNAYVFPWQELNKHYDGANHAHRRKINEIANRVILTRWPDKLEYTPNEPLKDLESVEQRYPGSLSAYFIPPDRNLWTIHRYEEFLRARRQLIAQAINNFINGFLHHAPPPAEDLPALIAAGETDAVEFKATLRLNDYTGKVDDSLKDKAAREIAAMMNAQGGRIIVGVNDDGTLRSVDADINSFPKATEDEYQRHLQEIVKGQLGAEYLPYVHIRFPIVDGTRLCIIDVEPSPRPVYVQRSTTERDFIVRLGSLAQKLDVKAALGYINQHWNHNGS